MLHTRLTSSFTTLSAKLLFTAAMALLLSACQNTDTEDEQLTAKKSGSVLPLNAFIKIKPLNLKNRPNSLA